MQPADQPLRDDDGADDDCEAEAVSGTSLGAGGGGDLGVTGTPTESPRGAVDLPGLWTPL